MAYYDALIAKLATLTGTDAEKIAQVNALTVPTGVPVTITLSPSAILNAIVPADLAALTATQVSFLTLVLQGSQVDVSVGTTVRQAVQTIFAGKTTTLTRLAALVAKADAPTMPWWQAPVSLSGGGLTAPVSMADLAAIAQQG